MTEIERSHQRAANSLRPITIQRRYTMHAEGSVLICCGNTKVLCTASVEERTAPFLRNTGKGWVTAEYGMLPRSTNSRMGREAARGKQSGRTQEIQRLIGRSLRAVVDLEAMGERTITLDCDVIQADGGTRTASITGAYVALVDAVNHLRANSILKKNPIHGQVAAISVGVVDGQAMLDLDYKEDSRAETDMNLVMNEAGGFIEIQGTAEGHAFRRDELSTMLDYGQQGIQQLIQMQTDALAEAQAD